MSCKHLKLLAILAGTGLCVLIVSSDADARWGSRGSWGSSGGSWGGSGGSWGGSGGSWGSRGSWGSSGGSWGYARGHRRVRRYNYGSNGSWGSWGSSGGGWGSNGSWGSGGGYAQAYSSYGSYGGTVSSSSPVYSSTPVYSSSPVYQEGEIYSAPTEAPMNGAGGGGDAPPLPSDDASTGVASDSVLLSVTVPEDAKVIINGYETKTTGVSRSYISRGLRAGQRYKYEIRAEVERDGQTSSDTKVVYVGAGQQSRLAFNFAAPPAGEGVEQPEERVVSQPDEVDEAPKTTLRLRVPEAATVTLAGAATKSTGGDRVYTTRRLAAGQTWDNYVVRAELERDGRRLTKEVRIRLQAGETRNLAIDFESADVTAVASAVSR